MKILINLTRPDFTVSVALHEDGQTVSVGIVGKPMIVAFPVVGERTIQPGYWEVTGKQADQIAHAATKVNDETYEHQIRDFLRVMGYYLPVTEETVPLSKVEEVAVEVGIKMAQQVTGIHYDWFESVLHKIGAQCGAMYKYDVPRLILDTVKEAQKEIEARREAIKTPESDLPAAPDYQGSSESYQWEESDLRPACPKCDHGMAHEIIKGPLTCLSCGYGGESQGKQTPPSIPHPRSMENVLR